MAILIVEHNGNVEGASLSGRVLIGRRASNHVVVDDAAVSRIHAWIDTADRQFCITDAGSRTGTFVNGQRVGATKVALKHGDRITVGPATLMFRSDGSLPAGVSQLNFDDRVAPQGTAQPDGGILFDCTCGAPLWISSDYAGRLGKCRFCGAVVRVPKLATTTPMPAAAAPIPAPVAAPPPAPQVLAAPAAPAAACGVCQSPIAAGEESTTCPSCGLTFHTDCWNENYGCSAYGCSQVNALLPKTDDATPGKVDPASAMNLLDDDTELPNDATAAAPASRVPPEYVLLAASVLALLISALTFGVPSLLSLVASVIYLVKTRGNRRDGKQRKVILAAAGLSLIGIAAGVAISYIWWLADATPGRGPDGIGVWNHNS